MHSLNGNFLIKIMCKDSLTSGLHLHLPVCTILSNILKQFYSSYMKKNIFVFQQSEKLLQGDKREAKKKTQPKITKILNM